MEWAVAAHAIHSCALDMGLARSDIEFLGLAQPAAVPLRVTRSWRLARKMIKALT